MIQATKPIPLNFRYNTQAGAIYFRHSLTREGGSFTLPSEAYSVEMGYYE